MFTLNSILVHNIFFYSILVFNIFQKFCFWFLTTKYNLSSHITLVSSPNNATKLELRVTVNEFFLCSFGVVGKQGQIRFKLGPKMSCSFHELVIILSF